MAEKRMISKVISISEKVNDLPDLFDMLLFTWMIPHTDDFGRLPGAPIKVKALVVPLLDKTKADIANSLQRLADQGLIHWYEVDGEQVIQIVQFEKHQQGLHKRTKSKFPEFPGSSGNIPTFPPEEKRREQNRKEQNRREEEGNGTDSPTLSPESNPHKDSILKLIKECEVEKVDMYSLDQIYSFIGLCDIEVIEAAIKKSSKKHVNYALNTLKNWITEGKTSLDKIDPKPQVGQYKGNRRSSGKPELQVVQPSEQDAPISDEELEAIMAMAKQMQNGEGGSNGNKESA